MKRLNGNTSIDEERLSHLKAYINCCIGQSIFQMEDLVSGKAKDRFLRMISNDLAALGKQTVQRGAEMARFLVGCVIGR